jgi:predicted TIM-barrel fold metal-dependent hydrolase
MTTPPVRRVLLSIALVGSLAYATVARPGVHGQAVPAGAGAPADLAAIEPIDTHLHAYTAPPALLALFTRLHLRALNILLIDSRDPLIKGFEPQWTDALAVRRATAGRAAVCTTIDPYGFEAADFVRTTTARLDHDFDAGAVAVKLYKVVGMHVKTRAGKYVLPDDPAFAPVFEHIAARGRTVVAHVAEPDSCWKPLDPASPDYSYYKAHPEEHAYQHPEWPSKESILAARDRMLAAHPTLKVVGAHLGSMEVDVDQIAARFDRYPNFAVDTAARIPYLMRQSPDKVRAFLIKYQDRVVYGTDLGIAPNDADGAVKEWVSTYERDWKYFSTGDVVQYEGGSTQGLQLPASVLRKLYHGNAVKWIPGIDAEQH